MNKAEEEKLICLEISNDQVFKNFTDNENFVHFEDLLILKEFIFSSWIKTLNQESYEEKLAKSVLFSKIKKNKYGHWGETWRLPTFVGYLYERFD